MDDKASEHLADEIGIPNHTDNEISRIENVSQNDNLNEENSLKLERNKIFTRIPTFPDNEMTMKSVHERVITRVVETDVTSKEFENLEREYISFKTGVENTINQLKREIQ